MKERLKAPELRFEGFTDDWEERKLGEVYNFQYGQFNNNPDNGGQYPIYGANGIIGGYDEYNSENAIVIGHMGAYAGHVLWAEGKHFVTYNGTMGIADKSILNSNFGYYLVVSVNVPKLTAGSGQPFVSYSDLNGIKILIPTIEEQQKIGSFFKQLDNTIALHQRKLDLLKEQKKGYLQKMFPKNGAKVPELRFAGFADDWEQRKLSDVANHRGGTAIEKYFDKDGVYKVISIGSYGLNSQYVDQNIRAISNEITDGRVVNSGELTMVLNDKTANGTIIGRTLLVEKDNEYVINQRTEIISPKENFDSSFAYTILNGPFREKVKRIVQGGTQIYVNYPAVSNLNLELPEIEEQQKIGSFFKQLDDTIALHQRKLDLLKEQKKGFLQKMFV